MMVRTCRVPLRRIRFNALWILAATTLCAIATAQEPPVTSGQNPHLIPRSREEREQIFRAEHHAILNVKVTDASGAPVLGLTSKDFSLSDNAQPRKFGPLGFVEHGTRMARPRVVLLLDVLNQSTREFGEDTVGVRKFFTRSTGELLAPTAIAVLSGSGLIIGDASTDRGVLLQQLDAMTRGVKSTRCEDLTEVPLLISGTWSDRSGIQQLPDQAPNCLNDKFILSITNLEHLALKEEDTPGRVVLIWIGPGWPRLEGKRFVPDTPDIKENFFEHLVLLTRAMREGQVTLDAISALDQRRAPKDRESIPGEVARPEDMSSRSLSLPAVVRRSGGQLQDESQGIPDAIAKCMQDAEFFYVLSFDFAAPPTPHEFHAIAVQVKRPGATVRTNTAYYAEP